MKTIVLSEKEKVESAGVDGLLQLYNAQFGESFAVVQHGDSPDFEFWNVSGHVLYVTVTITEDRPGNVKAVLGRSEHKSGRALREHLKAVREGRASSKSTA